MRIDRPTLMCDRCGHTTEDLGEMGAYATLRRSTVGGEQAWDLCPGCWVGFLDYLLEDK